MKALFLSRFDVAKWFVLGVVLCCGMPVSYVQAKTPAYSPYRQEKSNILYNHLFCDNLSAYRQFTGHINVLARTVLFADPPDISRLTRFVQSPSASSCQKLLAYHLLRQQKADTQKSTLLGVVVEVAFDNGLDTLAAYRDGRVFYIHRDGKLESVNKRDASLSGTLHKLFQDAQLVVENTQYWPEQRLPPPTAGQVRMTFLASDGIHYGEGSMHGLELNPLAGPVLTAATELLVKLLEQ